MLKSLKEQRDKLDREIEEIEIFLSVHKRISARMQHIQPVEKLSLSELYDEAVQADQTFKGRVEDEVAKILEGREDGHAHTRELVGLLEGRGVAINSPDMNGKIQRVSTILNRSGRFKADRQRGWSLLALPSLV